MIKRVYDSESANTSASASERGSRCIYTVVCHEEERALAELELRQLLRIPAVHLHASVNVISSSYRIDPSRSPFIKACLEVWVSAVALDQLLEQAIQVVIPPTERFKTVMLQTSKAHNMQERRRIERWVGQTIAGTADLQQPTLRIGIVHANNEWFLGLLTEPEPVWFKHNQKPHQYSTALHTRLARAIVNIAAPNPTDKRLIDPCCGIGTVLLEACSMGIAITGNDNNPLAVKGARENVAFFGYEAAVTYGPMQQLAGHYDAAILDLPYNLCSVLPDEEKASLLQHTARLAERVVIVTSEKIEAFLSSAGLSVLDRCVLRKGSFVRHIMLCESDGK